jgi:hypothetical protein
MWYNLKVECLNVRKYYLDDLGVSTKLFTVPLVTKLFPQLSGKYCQRKI